MLPQRLVPAEAQCTACRLAGYGPCLAATNHLHAAKVHAGLIHFQITFHAVAACC